MAGGGYPQGNTVGRRTGAAPAMQAEGLSLPAIANQLNAEDIPMLGGKG